MIVNRYAADVVAVAATVAALIYIGRQIGKLATLAKVLVRLPAEHDQLLRATTSNTANIAALTVQLATLTSDVAAMVAK